MLSVDEVEEELPSPIKIEICCRSEDFRRAVNDSFKKILDKHNKNYITEIESIGRHYLDIEDDDLDHNECRILIGKEVIHFMKGPDIFEDSDELSEEYYKSIVNVTEGILKTWHDKIIQIQNENEEKIEQFKMEGYDEMLFAYYNMRGDPRAFLYLKKLATRYPNTEYMRRLLRVYKTGWFGWHKKNPDLSRKMNRNNRRGREF